MSSPPRSTHSPRWQRPAFVASLLAMVGALLAPIGASASLAPTASSQQPRAAEDKITASLHKQFEKSGGAPQEFWITVDTDVDTSAARDIADWAERGQYVYDTLRAAITDAQSDVRDVLDAAGADYTAYWVSNAIQVRAGSRRMAELVAELPEVTELFPPVTLDAPKPRRIKLSGDKLGPNAVGDVEWGIADIKADQVWEQYGVRGDGIVVANIDTGVEFEHPALIDTYRGSSPDGTYDHDYNWLDVTGRYAFPADESGHGTHTMGTMVGDDHAANRTGVAPGARWITANGCATCSLDDLLAASEWMLAPTRTDGTGADPAMRPHVVNNSWSSNQPSTQPVFEDIQVAWADAGIFGVWSNGNHGPFCDTSGSPGSRVINYSVGAYGESGTIAGFSSRGAGQLGDVKPNIAAPGVSVRSSYRFNGYARHQRHLDGRTARRRIGGSAVERRPQPDR